MGRINLAPMWHGTPGGSRNEQAVGRLTIERISHPTSERASAGMCVVRVVNRDVDAVILTRSSREYRDIPEVNCNSLSLPHPLSFSISVMITYKPVIEKLRHFCLDSSIRYPIKEFMSWELLKKGQIPFSNTVVKIISF